MRRRRGLLVLVLSGLLAFGVLAAPSVQAATKTKVRIGQNMTTFRYRFKPKKVTIRKGSKGLRIR